MAHLLELVKGYLDFFKDYALPFIVVISIVVFVHEFGHYWVARRCGIRVLTFSIGFGRKIFGWSDAHGTQWQVAWIPMGGYVRMFGDADPSSRPDKSVTSMTDEEKKVAFYHQHVKKRIAVVLAGPAFNYIFAILVMALLFTFQGQAYSPANISQVIENSAAAKAGLQVGDHIVSIDHSDVSRFEDVRRIVALNAGSTIDIDVERNGDHMQLKVTPEIVDMTDRFGGVHRVGRIGVVSEKIEFKKWPPLRALKEAVLEAWHVSAGTLQAMGQMIMGTRAADELGGPLRIAEMSGHMAKDGLVSFISFMAFLSINLGFINLFPIPLLDGGHLVFYSYEWVRGRPVSETWQEYGARIGMVVVLSLMVFANWNDLVHYNVIAYLRGLVF